MESPIDKLPDSYNKNEKASKEKYKEFINAFGTHYVTRVDMGYCHFGYEIFEELCRGSSISNVH